MEQNRLRARGVLLGLGLFIGQAQAAYRPLPPPRPPRPAVEPSPRPTAGWLVLLGCGLAGLLTARMAGGSSGEGPTDEDEAARARDEEMLRQLGDLVSACPSCDRVLDRDEVWHHAASWLSLRSSLPRSELPCPACQGNTNSS